LKIKEFHAQPMPVVEPFQPSRSDKPLTEIQEFAFHTDQRMAERKEFEKEFEERRKQEEEAMAQYQKMKEVNVL
jgi:hypothetical protein